MHSTIGEPFAGRDGTNYSREGYRGGRDGPFSYGTDTASNVEIAYSSFTTTTNGRREFGTTFSVEIIFESLRIKDSPL